MSWTEDELAAHYARLKQPPEGAKPAPSGSDSVKNNPKLCAMNRWECEYAGLLETRYLAGDIQWFGFEPLVLRLADRTTYKPDFIVVTSKGSVEAHEVKGFQRDDAIVKFKVARELFPWIKFVMMQRARGGIWSQ